MSTRARQRWAVVTGANRGLGLEVCRRLHARGYRLVAAVRRLPEHSDLAELEGVEVVCADLRKLDAVEELAENVALMCNGQLDVLVNNAGVGFHSRAEKVVAAELSEAFHVNALAPILLISRLLPSIRLVEGHIVNITSRLASAKMPFTSAYTASKRALAGFADVVRLETGVRMTSIEPGAMETDFLQHTKDGPAVEFFARRDLARLDIRNVADLVMTVIESPLNLVIEHIEVVPKDQVL